LRIVVVHEPASRPALRGGRCLTGFTFPVAPALDAAWAAGWMAASQ
jgi:hypothetical protein